MTRPLAAACCVLLAACGAREDRIVVGAKNFTEQRILGELLAQTVEALGLPVERRLDLGGTFVCDTALRAGQIDMYVEYTGTALAAVLKEPPGDPATVFTRVRDAYAAANLVWTRRLGFDNTFALVVRDDAGTAGLATISAAVPAARGWTAAFGYEFAQRADGYPALAVAYGLHFEDVRTMDLGLIYRALVERQVDLVAGNATDAQIESLKLRILADDKHVFPPYEAAPVVRKAVLDAHPALAAALDALGGTITADAMRRLNYGVDGEHRSPADVVRAWLRTSAAPAR